VFPGIPTVFYIAPYTAHITAAEPDKICGTALVKSLSLDGVKTFHHG